MLLDFTPLGSFFLNHNSSGLRNIVFILVLRAARLNL